MPREIVSLHAGQCGNQIGAEFWKTLCREHAIEDDGVLQNTATEGLDARDVFFSEADDGRYTPRAVLFDLEPRVINGMKAGAQKSLFNRESIFLSTHGGGAGNNWASGHSQADAAREDILDMIDREARDADSLQGFLFTHSIAGGTGAGAGSLLLEVLADHFPKTLIHAYSVFPHKSDDVVVEPYNSVLTLKRLKHHAHAVTVLDNLALDALVAEQLKGTNDTPTVDQMNSLVAAAMAGTTAPLRFPGPTFTTMEEMLCHLAPAPHAHFLTASVAPAAASVRATSTQEVLRRLLRPAARLASQPAAAIAAVSARQLGGVAVLQGTVLPADVRQGLEQLRAAKSVIFAPSYKGSCMQVVAASSSPYVALQHRVFGVLSSNSTAVRHIFDRTLGLYDLLMQRKPFVAEYCKFPMFYTGEGRQRMPDLSEFDDAREELVALSASYRSLEGKAEGTR